MNFQRLIVLFSFSFILLSSCGTDSNSGRFDHLDQRTRIRLKQYLVEGKRLYEVYCSNCHQKEGQGLARLYPPLKDSDYLLPNKDKVICGIRYGQKGELLVNGVSFNQEMPGIPTITDLEIAEIATYVYTEFADSVQIITINDVVKILENCDKDTVSDTKSEALKNP